MLLAAVPKNTCSINTIIIIKLCFIVNTPPQYLVVSGDIPLNIGRCEALIPAPSQREGAG